jgi:site-specific DNA recombinase
MIAVVYARFSSGLQRDASIEDQIRLCRARIELEGWQYRHAYTDRAISRASALRPAYQSLLEDARRGQFSIVVAEALDRLSRATAVPAATASISVLIRWRRRSSTGCVAS